MAGKSKYTTESAVAAAVLKHGDKYDYTDAVFTPGDKSTITLRCFKHGVFTINFNGHVREGHGCKHCGQENRKRTKRGKVKNTPSEEEMHAKFQVVHGDRYIYPPGAYVNTSTLMDMVCRVHGPFQKLPSLHLRGHGCRQCHLEVVNKNKLGTFEEFFALAIKKHGDRFDYGKAIWRGFKKHIEIYCKEHKIHFWKEPYVHCRAESGGCPVCQRSKGELVIDSTLDRLGVEYIREFSFPGYQYEFDLYLPDYQLFIEFHGGQHYRVTNFHGGEDGLLTIRKRDAIKASMVKTAGAEMIVLDYDLFLKNTLVSTVERIMKDRPKKPRDIPFYTEWLKHQESLKPKPAF